MIHHDLHHIHSDHGENHHGVFHLWGNLDDYHHDQIHRVCPERILGGCLYHARQDGRLESPQTERQCVGRRREYDELESSVWVTGLIFWVIGFGLQGSDSIFCVEANGCVWMTRSRGFSEFLHHSLPQHRREVHYGAFLGNKTSLTLGSKSDLDVMNMVFVWETLT